MMDRAIIGRNPVTRDGISVDREPTRRAGGTRVGFAGGGGSGSQVVNHPPKPGTPHLRLCLAIPILVVGSAM